MKLDLADWVWDELLEGLEARRQQLAEDQCPDRAEEVGKLISTLERDLGATAPGGERIMALRFVARLNGRPLPVELRIAE